MDQIVNFETAKLAKEKRFDKESESYYKQSGELLYDIEFPFLQPTKLDKYCNAPTQTELQKWLREVYNKHIQIALATNPRKCFVYFIQDDKGVTIEWNTDPELIFDTYEEALEIGLQKALEMI